jgi:16S rRNA G966 N2-methylase RsmD
MNEPNNFPYRNNLYSNADKINLFKNLIHHKFTKTINKKPTYNNIKMLETIFLYKGRYQYIIYENSDYEKFMILSDLFLDNCRSDCSFGNKPSPKEYYKQNYNYLVSYLKKNNQENTKYNMREAIYKNIKLECSTHNPAIIKYFITRYNAKKVLDMSAGWGDRLLGALASPIDLYVGVDPNKCTHPGYQDMIKTLAPYSPNPNGKYILIEDKFETAKIEYDNFDLVYSSPPYFDYEKYTSDESNASKQSYITHNTEDLWLNNFLKVSVSKSIKLLKHNGYLILYIGQERGKSYMEKFMDWAFKLTDICYIGCIYYANVGLSAHPIFIFKKTFKIPKILYNPKPVVEKINIFDKSINVFRDDYLVGGTKVRAAVKLFKNIFKNDIIDTVIYYGAANGYAQICVAYTLFLMKKSDIKLVLISKRFDLSDIKILHKIVLFYHPNTEFIIKDPHAKTQILWDIYDRYDKPNQYKIPFGFKFDKYEKILYNQLFSYMQKYVGEIKRIWLVVGSGTILSVLQKLLPQTHFLGVQVGRTIKDNEIYDKSRLTLYVSNFQLFEEDPNLKTDFYNTTKSYDGKVLEFVEKYGSDGDYIWNVAGIHKMVQ